MDKKEKKDLSKEFEEWKEVVEKYGGIEKWVEDQEKKKWWLRRK